MTCFFWLRQLRRVGRSLDVESVKTLVHDFVTSRVDYCNLVLASTPKIVTDKLQSVLNAAARLITVTQEYERGLSRLMHDDLQWLTVPQRLQYKLAVTVHRCLQHRASRYLTDYCVPVSEDPGRHHLWSARRRQLPVPRVHCSMFESRSFSVVRPTVLKFTARWYAGSSCWFSTFSAALKNTSIHWTLWSLSTLLV